MFLLAHLDRPIDPKSLAHLHLEFFEESAPQILIGYGGPMCEAQRGDHIFRVSEGSSSYKPGAFPDGVSSVEWDAARQRVSLSRGIASGHAVYVSINPAGEFVIATHMRLIRALGVILREDPDTLGEFMLYRHIAPPRTMYAGVQSIPLGSTAHIELGAAPLLVLEDSCVLKLGKGYTPESPEDRAARFSDHLRQAVSGIATPPSTAFLLSGGIDSSILYTIGSRELGVRRSYSTGYPFEDRASDTEQLYAESAAAALRADHTHVRWDNGQYLHGLIDAIDAAEVPIHHLQSVLLHLLFRSGMQPNEAIIVCGEGADTIVGTLFQRRIWRALHRRWLWSLVERSPMVDLLNTLVRITGSGRGVSWILRNRNELARDMSDPAHPIWQASRYGSTPWVRQYFALSDEQILAHRLKVLESVSSESLIERIGLFGILADVSVTASIWNSLAMAAGRQLMFPFLSSSILHDGFRIPLEYKFKRRKQVALDIGYHLDIPKFILTRPKSGFGIDPARWALPDAAFQPLVRLAAPVFPEHVLRPLQSADHDTAMSFWNAICYAIWKRLWIDRESTTTLHAELEDQLEKATSSSRHT